MLGSMKQTAAALTLSNLLYLAEKAPDDSERRDFMRYAAGLMREKYKHIIFDLDGTLIDTEKAVLKTWRQTLSEYGHTYSLRELRPVLGITTEAALKKLDVNAADDFEARWMEVYSQFADEADFFSGIAEMLLSLKASGYFLGIVTSRCRNELKRYFAKFHLDRFFDFMICADDTKLHKPQPDPLYRYTHIAGTEVSSCLYIGDMPTDMECADSASMSSGMAGWNPSVMFCTEADYIFHSPEDITEMFTDSRHS